MAHLVWLSLPLRKKLGKNLRSRYNEQILLTLQLSNDPITQVSSKSHKGKTAYVSLQREARILSKLNHRNVIKFKKLIETDTRYLLVMEWLKGGQLRQLMKETIKEGRTFTEEEASMIIKGIVEGIAYIHSNDTIHRDLKPGLLTS